MTMTIQSRPVRRETPTYAGSGRHHKPIVVELGAHIIRVKLKGTRTWYEVSYSQIFNRGAQNAADDARRERLAKKGRR